MRTPLISDTLRGKNDDHAKEQAAEHLDHVEV
jgi:hypothetical protein